MNCFYCLATISSKEQSYSAKVREYMFGRESLLVCRFHLFCFEDFKRERHPYIYWPHIHYELVASRLHNVPKRKGEQLEARQKELR